MRLKWIVILFALLFCFHSVQAIDNYSIRNAYLTFDTSAVSGTITAAKLGLKTKADNSATDFNLMVYHGTCMGSDNLDAGDWNACVDSGTYDGNLLNTANYVDEIYLTLSVPTSAINADGNTQFELTSNRYLARNEPTGLEYLTFHSADSTGNEPYLEITTQALFNIDQNKVCFPYAGGTTTSSSFQTRVSVEQGFAGRGTSSSFASEIGCIYGFENAPPTVGRIRICDGTCAVTKTNANNNTWFTLEVDVTDPNGQNDINTEMFRVTMFHNTDANTCTEDWDCNAMTILDDNISLFTANGCAQGGSTYCLNIPKTAWTIKFLLGDVNLYVAVDDNSGSYDSNHVDNNAFTIVKTVGRSEDTAAGTYSADPDTTNNEINNTDTSNNYIESTHNGNANIDVALRATDLNVNATTFIGDGNQSWSLNEDANGAGSTNFPGPDTTIMADWNRGTYATSSALRLFYYLDIPLGTKAGDYNGAIVYGSSAS